MDETEAYRLTTLKRGADPESSEDRAAGGSHDHRVSPLQVTAVRTQVSPTRNQLTQTVQLMTAGLHFGEIKKIPATEKARKIVQIYVPRSALSLP